MTRERLREIQVAFTEAILWDASVTADSSRLMLRETIEALEEAWDKLSAWESGCLTEEMLRDHEGYLKLNRGVVLVSEQYLEELQATRDAVRRDITFSIPHNGYTVVIRCDDKGRLKP